MTSRSQLRCRRLVRAAVAPAPLGLVPVLAVAVFAGGGAATKPGFGPNALIFNPSMPSAAIQEKMDAIHATQGGSQFGTARYAPLFMPGSYTVDVPVGYYTQVLGLGASPDKVDITGNLKAVPQAAAFRRMYVRGDAALRQNQGLASGGSMSDTLVDGTVSSGPQQQWVSRNTEWGGR